MKIEELKKKREKIAERLKSLNAQIAKIERAEREQEQREILRMIQSRGITAAQLNELLNSKSTAERLVDLLDSHSGSCEQPSEK
jgi:peptidoglycan hydrolase CwlO-like protein